MAFLKIHRRVCIATWCALWGFSAWAQQAAPAAKPPAAKPAVKASSAAASASANGLAKTNLVGTLDLLSGTVTITSLKGSPRDITIGMAIEEGDTIVTEDDSEAHATMADGAYFAVRANTKIKIAAYAANGNARDRSWVDLLTGSLRTVTGWIGKSRPKAYRIVTPTATIGVRGTDHEVVYLTEEQAETPEEAGTHNVVFEGATVIETPKGRVNVQVGQAAFILPKDAVPQLYGRELPVFLIRARGQYDNDLVQHRTNLDGIMQRGLIDRGLMREGQNLQDVFRRIGGDGYISNSGLNSNQQRQIQGTQSEIFKQTFGGPGNTKEPLPVPFGISGPGNTNAPPPISFPSPGGGGGIPSFPKR